MTRNIKKNIIFILNLLIICLFANIVIRIMGLEEGNKVSLSYFIDNILKSIYFISDDGEKAMNFVRILTIISMYLVIEINIINYSCYLSEGMKEIVRYHSKSKFDYLVKVLKISQKYVLKNIIYWMILISFIVFILNKVQIANFNDTVILVWFLVINYVFTSFIIIVSNIPLTTIILFVSKLFIYNIFLGKEYYLLIIIALILLVYLNITRKIGEKLWKLG
jgi:membrane protein